MRGHHIWFWLQGRFFLWRSIGILIVCCYRILTNSFLGCFLCIKCQFWFYRSIGRFYRCFQFKVFFLLKFGICLLVRCLSKSWVFLDWGGLHLRGFPIWIELRCIFWFQGWAWLLQLGRGVFMGFVEFDKVVFFSVR